MTGSALLLMLCGAMALALTASAVIAIGTEASAAREWPDLSPKAVSLLGKASTVLVCLTTIGTVSFAVMLVRAGVDVTDLHAASGYRGSPAIKDTVGTVPGLTTMTQFGCPAVIVSSLSLAQRISRAEVIKVCAVMAMALPRAFLWSERLAIVELVVPLAVVACMRMATNGRVTRIVQWSPIIVIPGSIAVFAGFEYFRSWNFYRGHNDGLLQFSVERGAGYYATAINNGFLELTHLTRTGGAPDRTVDFLYEAPGLQQLGLQSWVLGDLPGRNGPATDADYEMLLNHHANPEFNNSTGYAAPFLDYGVTLGLVYFAVVGVIAGLLYRSFRNGEAFGLLAYPLLFFGLIELPRYVQWAEGRFFPSWIALIVLAMTLKRVTRHESLMAGQMAGATRAMSGVQR
ncbi:oligosaccharide repeat unit polymerase [Mycobacterium manitobense]|uniref:Oligosaccharide repeat unit polymerase n=1 Tax=[Mycobacterium] manitobense TaxID=190147 RepID=A0A9X2YRA9_9MYCO|nr:O-antigen polymerase [[Mycobacterium] manitobense]MCV7171926.1 oligosaccharide repeat unit polymerase [[Mycobacterium] manitobense]